MRGAERHSQLKNFFCFGRLPVRSVFLEFVFLFPVECHGPKAPGECCQVSHHEKYIIYIYLKRKYTYMYMLEREKRSILVKDDLFHVASPADLKFILYRPHLYSCSLMLKLTFAQSQCYFF